MIGLVWKTIYPEGKLPHFELRPESCCVAVGGGGGGDGEINSRLFILQLLHVPFLLRKGNCYEA